MCWGLADNVLPWTVKIGRDSFPKFAAALFIYLFAVGLYLMLECFNPNSFAISFVRFAQINRWWIGDWTNNIDAAFKVLAVRIGDLPGKCVLWRRPLSPEMNGRWCMTLETLSPQDTLLHTFKIRILGSEWYLHAGYLIVEQAHLRYKGDIQSIHSSSRNAMRYHSGNNTINSRIIGFFCKCRT